MAVNIELEEENDSEIEYPLLMISGNSTIVLFVEDKKGFVIRKPTDKPVPVGDPNRTGEYSEGWVMSAFKPYNGKITISNK